VRPARSITSVTDKRKLATALIMVEVAKKRINVTKAVLSPCPQRPVLVSFVSIGLVRVSIIKTRAHFDQVRKMIAKVSDGAGKGHLGTVLN
jgi:hypothetical protein